MSITLIIIIVTVGLSLMANNNTEVYSRMVFNPYQVIHRKEWHRLVTHAFVHDKGNILHLIFNMYVLYSFGNVVELFLEQTVGNLASLFYIFIYFGGVIAATIPSLIKHKDNYGYNSVGASGAVSAILFSAIAFMPLEGGIGIIFIPISLPPIVFGVLYIAYEMYMDKRGGTNVAHDAHIGGAAFGFLFTLLFIPNVLSNFIAQLLSVF
jgi:membrane associated rhomboid family serine protease